MLRNVDQALARRQKKRKEKNVGLSKGRQKIRKEKNKNEKNFIADCLLKHPSKFPPLPPSDRLDSLRFSNKIYGFLMFIFPLSVNKYSDCWNVNYGQCMSITLDTIYFPISVFHIQKLSSYLNALQQFSNQHST
ncbi:CLUMA_CG010359, isoform A [Clunio marinus]|uniref:CLUMA_CG010359, isoform A n=1 Tax=Clunio marinus TaxID=568069 RepID=A0A1J1I9R3_9DIPT|nr:CLUMA_CG010359, isoform A [Clunio marinus]